MELSSDSDDSLDFHWDKDDPESSPSRAALTGTSNEASEAGPSQTNWTSHFVAMGFSEDLVVKAIEQNREGDTEGVLETLLTYGVVEQSPSQNVESSTSYPLNDKDVEGDDFSDMDDCGFENTTDDFSENDYMISTLVDMGFLPEEASSAIDRCGPNASVLELADSIRAAQMQEDSGDQLWCFPTSCSSDNEENGCRYHTSEKNKRKKSELKGKNKKICVTAKMRAKDDCDDYDDIEPAAISTQLTGFSLPFQPAQITSRKLSEAAIGPPFFYYENVAMTLKGVWGKMSRFLYDVEPEFVDSLHFCAAARKRGYVHNLPIHNRFPLLPIPPKRIHEAFPSTRKWWPPWDTRTHLNCIQTSIAPPKLSERLRQLLDQSDDPPPQRVQQHVLYECRKWNLVWIGLHKVVPLEPDEIEMLLGFPRNHTRGISRSERYKSLGNSFQVDTIAFHLSVLKDMFPNGITVLSLFSGIGGAEVALHRLGIRLKTVVTVELSEVNRSVVRSWWEQTGQIGNLIEICDVQKLNGDRLEHLIKTYGGFDLVIGGSPCNNLTGSNRYSRDGLEGKQSALFYDYVRILDLVKCIMGGD